MVLPYTCTYNGVVNQLDSAAKSYLQDNFGATPEQTQGKQSLDLNGNVRIGSDYKSVLHVSLSTCSPVSGSSGDGSVVFNSTPPTGTMVWPFTLTNSLSGRELNQSFRDLVTQDNWVLAGATWSQYSDALDDPDGVGSKVNKHQNITIDWESTSGDHGGTFLYVDKLTIVYPEVFIAIAKELFDAHDSQCWYSRVLQHEMTHEGHYENAFRQIQLRLIDLINDQTTPAPRHPTLVSNQSAANLVQTQFGDKVKQIVTEQIETELTNAATMDNADAYGSEDQMCPLPVEMMKSWIE